MKDAEPVDVGNEGTNLCRVRVVRGAFEVLSRYDERLFTVVG
jgi:hypothetical protein